MKKTTITMLAAGLVLTTGSLAMAFGGSQGMGGPMMQGYGMAKHMMYGSAMGGPMKGAGIFRQADANNDGVVTKEEVAAMKDARFAKYDSNNDGVVDTAEIDKALEAKLERMRIKMRYKMLGRFDANGDGMVSKDEFSVKGMNRFEMLDANNDGKITREEVQAMAAKARKRFSRKGHGPRRGGGQYKHGMGGAW